MKIVDKGKRAGNFLIDLIIILIINIPISIFAMIYFSSNEADSFLDIAFGLVFFLYYFICEYFFGFTIAKLLTKTRVVANDGAKPGFIKILLRSLLRFIPIDAFTIIFGNSPLHDIGSKTKVVNQSK